MVEQHQSVNEDVALGMKFRWLCDPLHGRDLRQDVTKHAAFIQQQKRFVPLALGQHAGQLIAYPLSRDQSNLVRQYFDGLECARVDDVAEAGGKPHRPQHAQLVFREAKLRIANRPNHSRSQVFPSPNKVQDLSAYRIEQHAVDGEIAARDILPRVSAEPHLIGMPPVRIADVAAKGSHFDRRGLRRLARSLGHRHQHNSKLRSHRIRFREDTHHLLGGGVGHDIPVLGLPLEQQVAHASPHQVGLKALLTQGVDDRSGKVFQHRARSSRITFP